MPEGLRDAALDLLLGGTCVGCARPGRLLCRDCAAGLPSGARPAWPSPPPAGLVAPWAAAAYDGTVRALVIGHKEHRLLGLREPLAQLLGHAVAAAVPEGPVVLVPVPSRRATVRARGHDPTGAITARAAELLRARGYDVLAHPLLRPRPGVVDQAGLDAAARAANLAGSMCCPSAGIRGLARLRPRARLVVCDDVITTGATAREAQRALEAVGLRVAALAAVAATRKRVPVVTSECRQAGRGDSWGLGLSSGPGTH